MISSEANRMYFAARDASLAGHSDVAIAGYAAVLESNPSFVPAMRSYTHYLINIGELADALKVLADWFPSDDKERIVKRALQAVTLLELGRNDDVLQILGCSDDNKLPADIGPLECMLASSAWEKLGDLDMAAYWASRACELNPSSPDALQLQLLVARLQEDKATIRAAAKKLVKIECLAHVNRTVAKVLIRADDLDGAITVLLSARDTFKDDAWIAATLGWALSQREEYAAAVPHLEQAVALGDDRAWTVNTYLITLAAAERYDEGKRYLDAMSDTAAVSADALWTIGVMAIEAKDCDVAKSILPLLRSKDEVRANRLMTSIVRHCP